MHLNTILLYLATWSLVALSPGPAVMCAMSQATRHGFRSSLAGIAGIQLGHLFFFGCVAGGLAALLATASTAFTLLRLLGAAYLCYLGVRIISATFRSRAAAPPAATPPPARRRLFLQGVGIQITNPKALLFMSALLPQFIQPRVSLPLQLGVFFALTSAVDVLVLSAYAHFAARGARSWRHGAAAMWLERAFGAALVLFGVRLFATRR